ncbi:competence protein CoiA [Streptomyces sp. NBC_00481]|uniref:competence protein CoiA family protein n=1 Tax=Streptomyces sp. NBC_00481 TaxID=2975755 RepID=UPI002DDBA477|nr:competence protein CoiA family protein [Streptomyces sp. NBC_00481]WRY94434.1 competence protein CoiA [Streptomyces sp. NBC_00481]
MVSPTSEEDTRKVQTAVIGQAESDWPVFLPYDHDDFDRFMRGRTRDDFYCGVLLGGCGKKLTPKRYTEKKCHFAHRPPVHCRRTETGEASADHLYIGQALRRWLLRQGYQDAEVTYLDPGSVHGGAVEVRFGQGRSQLIRVQLARLSLREWQETRERLADRHTHVHWAYGPYCGLSHNEVDAAGHAIRISCRTEGETREVYVGTQYPDNSLAWSALTECRLSNEGIITPRLDAEPPASSTPAPTPTPVAFPLAPGTIAFTAATELPAPHPDPDGAVIRLYEVDLQPLGSAVVRARIALPHAHPAPPPHQLHVIYSSAHLLPLTQAAPSEPAWLIRADGASPLPQQTDSRWPDLRPVSPPPEPPQLTPTTTEPAASTPRPLPLGEAETIHVLVSRLGVVARARGLINWETLISHAGAAPGDITPDERVRLLIAVDHPRADGKPVLSALVKPALTPEAPAPYFAEVLAGLGWRSDLSEAKVAEVWERERRTAYALAQNASTPELQQSPNTSVQKSATRLWNDAQLVGRIREHLNLVANGRSRIKWKTLLNRQGISPSTVSVKDQVRLLAAVDKPYVPSRGLLSALVKEDGQASGPAPFFGDVLTELGWKPDATTPTMEAAWRVALDRAYARSRRSAPTAQSSPAVPSAKEDRVHWSKLGTTKVAATVAVRRALIDAAQRQVCVGWHTLAAAAGLKPSDLSDKARESILVAVDSPPTYGVLLSSLVVASEHTPVPYFDAILKRLGRPHGLRPIELGQLRKTEQARVFAAYSAAADTTDDPKQRA